MSNALIPFLFGDFPNPLPTKAVVGYLEIGCQIKFEENNLLKHGFLYEVKDAYVFDNPIYVSKEQALILAETDSASSSVATFLF